MPYTVSISNPSYATIAGSAWNWGASGAANNGVISGPLTAVSINLALPLQSTDSLAPALKATSCIKDLGRGGVIEHSR